MTTVSNQPQALEAQQTNGVSLWDICSGIVPAITVLPLLLGQAWSLWSTPETKFGLLIWLVLAIIVGLRARGGITRHWLRMHAALLVLMLGCASLLWGIVWWSLNWGHLSLCLFLIAWALGRCSQRSWHEVVSWGCLLAVTIPILPIHSDFDHRISRVAAEYASATLDFFKVPHFLESMSLTLQHGQFNAASTTSPKLGLYTIVCCSVVWCWLLGRSLSATLLVVLGAVCGLLLTRYLAILLVSYGFLHYQSDWTASGRVHYLISAGAFLACLLLTGLWDRAVVAMFKPIPFGSHESMAIFATANAILLWPRALESDNSGDFDEIPEFQSYKQRLEHWRLSWFSFDWDRKPLFKSAMLACGLFCGLAAIPVLIAAVRGGLVDQPTPPLKLRLDALGQVATAELLPTILGEFRQVQFHGPGKTTNDEKPQPGQLSARWHYLWDGYQVVVDLQAPLTDWQAPTPANDSSTTNNSVDLKEATSTNGWAWFNGRQTNALGGDAYWMQCCLADDLSAATLQKQHESSRWPILARLAGDSQQPLLLYNIQVYCESGSPLSSDRRNELQSFFQSVRKQLQTKLPANQLQKAIVGKD